MNPGDLTQRITLQSYVEIADGIGGRAAHVEEAPAGDAVHVFLRQARQRGYSLTLEIYNPGMGAMAAPVRRPRSPQLQPSSCPTMQATSRVRRSTSTAAACR